MMDILKEWTGKAEHCFYNHGLVHDGDIDQTCQDFCWAESDTMRFTSESAHHDFMEMCHYECMNGNIHHGDSHGKYGDYGDYGHYGTEDGHWDDNKDPNAHYGEEGKWDGSATGGDWDESKDYGDDTTGPRGFGDYGDEQTVPPPSSVEYGEYDEENAEAAAWNGRRRL
jgi:hypothetical protein